MNLEDEEQRLYILQKQKITQLERKLLMQEQSHNELVSKYKELDEDFNFNLKAIQQRDQDIEEMTEKLLELQELLDSEIQNRKQLELQMESQRQKYVRELDDTQERFENTRKELRFLKKRSEDQIKDLKFLLEQRQQTFEQVQEETIKRTEGPLKQLVMNLQSDLAKLEQVKEDLFQKLEQAFAQNENEREQAREKVLKLESFIAELQSQLQKEKDTQQQIDSGYKQEFKILQQKLQTQQIILDQLKNDNHNMAEIKQAIETKLNDKLEQVTLERDQLNMKLQQQALDKKQKVAYLKENCDRRIQEAQRDCEERIRKNEYEKQLTQIDYERLAVQEKHLQERLIEIEGRLRREQTDAEQRIALHSRNQEQNKRQIMNDLEVKEFTIKQLKEETQAQQQTIIQLNKAIDDVSKKFQEISAENKILIEEVVKYRKANKQLIKGQSILQPQQANQPQLSTISVKNKQSPRSDRRNPSSKARFLMDQEEVLSMFEREFTEDEGPAQQLRPKRTQLSITESKQQQEIEMYKKMIDDMNTAMQTVAQKAQNLTKEIAILREAKLDKESEILNQRKRYLDLEEQCKKMEFDLRKLDHLKEEYNKTDEELIALKRKYDELMQEYRKLSQEKDQMVYVIQKLNQKLKDQEDQHVRELAKFQDDIQLLTKEITNLQEQKPAIIEQEEPEISFQPAQSYLEQQKLNIQMIKAKYAQR